jgi:hypothetical protein
MASTCSCSHARRQEAARDAFAATFVPSIAIVPSLPSPAFAQINKT